MDYQCLDFTLADRVACITLNRPDAANGLNAQMATELADVAAACDADAQVRAVILRGSGKFFCAGGDLKAIAAQGTEAARYVKQLADQLHRAVSTLARMHAPLITAVNGVAAGAGFSIVLASDLSVAAPKAQFTMAYTRAGLSPDGSASYFLPRIVGLRRAQELMLTNRTLSANEALQWGIVNAVAEQDALDAQAWDWAEMLATGSSQANAAVKTLLEASFNQSLETQMEQEARTITACARSPEGQEGIDAFLHKRHPRFT